MSSEKFAMRVAYVGTRFYGWQNQTGSARDGGPSVQETIEKALREVSSEPTAKIVGSGRTDSGVHAVGQVAHFVLKKKKREPSNLLRGMNTWLTLNADAQIQILAVQRAPLDFHAQKSAIKKQYSYYYQQGPTALPHLMPFSRWIKRPLDLKAMNQAARYLVGEHDFKPFQASGAKPGPTVREIFEADVTPVTIALPQAPAGGYELIRFRVVGSGFLKQMVRGMAGTLLQIGENKRVPGDIRVILETQDRSLLGATAPARGLWLEEVWYPDLRW